MLRASTDSGHRGLWPGHGGDLVVGRAGFEATALEAATFLEAVGASSWAPFMHAVQVLAAMTLLWWSVGFIRSFGRVEDEATWLPIAAIASMTAFAAFVLLGSSWAIALQLEDVSPQLGSPRSTRATSVSPARGWAWRDSPWRAAGRSWPMAGSPTGRGGCR